MVTNERVELVRYTVSSMKTSSEIDIAFVQQASPTIIWDKLEPD